MKVIHSNKSDEELVELYQVTQKNHYLVHLYDRYFHLIYGSCLKHLESENDAKDVCMEIYELLAQKLLSHQVNHYKSWLYRVTFNQCMQFLRKKKQRTEKIKEFKLNQDENMEFNLFYHPNINKEELLVHLENCIEKLKEEQKKSIQLFYLKQLCYNEIVEQTGYALKKVKSYIQNGKRNLKICIESKSE